MRRDELGALVLLPAPDVVDALADKWLAHLLFVERGIGSPATWLPDALPGRARLPGAREGAQGLRLARHLPLHGPPRARVLPRVHDGGLDGAGDVPRRGVLDRSLLRSRVALPERGPAHDDRVEGRRVDQGDDDSPTPSCRGGPSRRRDASGSSARRTSSASASRTARIASPTSTRASAARFRCRRLPAAATRSSRSRSRRASGLSPRLGDFRADLYMTRFFSELVLSAGRGRYVGAVRGRAARAARRALVVVLLLGSVAACGGSHRSAAPVAPSARFASDRRCRRSLHVPARLVVTVVDGDRSTRVRRAARDALGPAAHAPDANGVAEIRVPWRRTLHVTVGARGYSARTVLRELRGIARR